MPEKISRRQAIVKISALFGLAATGGCAFLEGPKPLGDVENYQPPASVHAAAVQIKREKDDLRTRDPGWLGDRVLGNIHGPSTYTSPDGDFTFGPSRSSQTGGVHYNRDGKYMP